MPRAKAGTFGHSIVAIVMFVTAGCVSDERVANSPTSELENESNVPEFVMQEFNLLNAFDKIEVERLELRRANEPISATVRSSVLDQKLLLADFGYHVNWNQDARTYELRHGTPKHARAVIADEILYELNSYDRSAIDLLERPDAYAGRVQIGSIGGIVWDWRERLKKLGYDLRWNRDTRYYELVELD